MKKMLKSAGWIALLATPLLLAGCLEIEQYPVWRAGEYDGKPDNRAQDVHFHRDKLAWNAAISNRNQRQNEYRRTHP